MVTTCRSSTIHHDLNRPYPTRERNRSEERRIGPTWEFGAEFIATKTGVEALRGIRYKLRMMGVPLTGPTYIYGENMSIIYNTS